MHVRVNLFRQLLYLKPGVEDGLRRQNKRRGQRRVILHMQVAHVSTLRADTHSWESVQTCKLLLIGRRLESVQTGRPTADDARTPQGHVNNFGHMTPIIGQFFRKSNNIYKSCK